MLNDLIYHWIWIPSSGELQQTCNPFLSTRSTREREWERESDRETEWDSEWEAPEEVLEAEPEDADCLNEGESWVVLRLLVLRVAGWCHHILQFVYFQHVCMLRTKGKTSCSKADEFSEKFRTALKEMTPLYPETFLKILKFWNGMSCLSLKMFDSCVVNYKSMAHSLF